jgi:hypothetical protein
MNDEIKKSPDKFTPAQEEYNIAKAKLEQFERLIKDVKSKIEAERGKGAIDVSGLKAAVEERKIQYTKNQEDANLYKDRIDKLKQDISDWKQWYTFLADIDKTEQLKRLDIEVRWRATEIKQLQEKIGALEVEKLNAKLFLMESSQKLLAIEKDLHKQPVENDPRLLSVIAMRDSAATQFNAAKKLIEPNN